MKTNERLFVCLNGKCQVASLILTGYEWLFCVKSQNKTTYVKLRDYPYYATIYKNGMGDFFNLLTGDNCNGDFSFVFFKSKEETRAYADRVEINNPEVYVGVTEICDFYMAGKNVYNKLDY